MVDYGQMISLSWSKLKMIEIYDDQHDQPLDHGQT